MYRSNRSFNIPPGHIPGIWHLCRPGEEGIWLSESSRGWGIWSPCVRGGEFKLHPRFHVKSLAWRAVMGGAVLKDFRGKLNGWVFLKKNSLYVAWHTKKQWAFSDIVAAISAACTRLLFVVNTLTVLLCFCYIGCELFAVFIKILFDNWRRFCLPSVIYVPVKCFRGGGIWSPEWTLVWGIWPG